MRQLIEQSWRQPNLLSVMLWPLACLYRVLSILRRQLYRTGVLSSYRAPVPVIVVGNLTVGGSGKTPLVIHLIELLRSQGYKPGVISRGYGSQAESLPLLINANTPILESGDEPALIVKRTQVPLVIGPSRQVDCEQLLANADVDIIISDDGLQHYALQRDIEICLVDHTSPLTNRWIFPAGPYREPLTRLKQVDLIVDHVATETKETNYQGQNHSMFLQAAEPKPLIKDNPREWEPSNPIQAIAGIGNPDRFFNTCRSLGWQVVEHVFADHHRFNANDIQFNHQQTVLMTEKDAVKCTEFAELNHWYLPVDATLDSKFEPALLQLLTTKLQQSTEM